MESYFEKEAKLNELSTTLSRHAKAYQPTYVDLQQPHVQEQYATQDNRKGRQLKPEDANLSRIILVCSEQIQVSFSLNALVTEVMKHQLSTAYCKGNMK